MTGDDVEELRRQTERGSRLEESATDGEDIVGELVTALDDIETGAEGKTIAVRDKPMAALLRTLDDHPDEMVEVGQALQRALGRDVQDGFDKSEISRLAFRVGLQEAVPGYMEDLQRAHSEHMQDYL